MVVDFRVALPVLKTRTVDGGTSLAFSVSLKVDYGNEFFMVNRAFKAIRRADVVLLMVDVEAGITDQVTPQYTAALLCFLGGPSVYVKYTCKCFAIPSLAGKSSSLATCATVHLTHFVLDRRRVRAPFQLRQTSKIEIERGPRPVDPPVSPLRG